MTPLDESQFPYDYVVTIQLAWPRGEVHYQTDHLADARGLWLLKVFIRFCSRSLARRSRRFFGIQGQNRRQMGRTITEHRSGLERTMPRGCAGAGAVEWAPGRAT